MTPVTNNIGSVVAGNENYTLGYLKFSSDGTKLVCCNLDLSVELFDFDLASGLISNVKQ